MTKVIKCSICGKQMAIPPGYENTPGTCTGCGAEVNVPPPGDDASPAPAPTPEVRQASFVEELRGTIPAAAAWGLAGALAGGIALASILCFIASRGETIVLSGVIATADSGALMGFVICSTWVIVVRTSAGAIAGALVAGCMSLPLGILCYLMEWAFITRPDESILLMAFVSLIGGLFAGLLIGSLAPSFTE